MAEILTPNCPLFGPGDEPASCGSDDCPMISWSPSLGLGLYLAPGNVLSSWRRREPCEDHDGGMRACCGTRQLGPHAEDCPKPASFQDAMLDHERTYRHETEASDG